jgi:hypothetical protein
MEENPKKTWKTYGVFDTYEDASAEKMGIVDKFDLVKIRRSGPGGNQFKIKTWTEPTAKPNKKKTKKK